VKILSNWKEYLKKGGIQLSTGIDKRLCVTVPEAAEMLGISRNFGYKLVREGKLPVIRLGEKRLVIPIAALDRMLEEGVEQCKG
jgi:excisionase family DNA binding protein